MMEDDPTRQINIKRQSQGQSILLLTFKLRFQAENSDAKKPKSLFPNRQAL